MGFSDGYRGCDSGDSKSEDDRKEAHGGLAELVLVCFRRLLVFSLVKTMTVKAQVLDR